MSIYHATNQVTSNITIDDIRQAMEEADRITAKHEMRQAGFNLHAIADKCPTCGYKYSAHGGTLRVCAHQLNVIKEHCAEPEVGTQADFTSPLLGMRIEVYAP